MKLRPKLTTEEKLYLLEQNKQLTERLKENMYKLTGKEYKSKEKNELDRVSNIQKTKRYDYTGLMFNFQCPRCKGRNTRRSGITTQPNKKARMFCMTCFAKRKETNDNNVKCYFVLTNQQIIDEIRIDKTLNQLKKKFFIEKYSITKDF